MFRALLSLRELNQATSALLMIPLEYIRSHQARTFLHAYCQKGEVYRHGTLFKRPGSNEYLHLNTPIAEFWFDGEIAPLSDLTPRQKKQLAGKRSAPRRSTQMLLVVKNPWLDLTSSNVAHVTNRPSACHDC